MEAAAATAEKHKAAQAEKREMEKARRMAMQEAAALHRVQGDVETLQKGRVLAAREERAVACRGSHSAHAWRGRAFFIAPTLHCTVLSFRPHLLALIDMCIALCVYCVCLQVAWREDAVEAVVRRNHQAVDRAMQVAQQQKILSARSAAAAAELPHEAGGTSAGAAEGTDITGGVAQPKGGTVTPRPASDSLSRPAQRSSSPRKLTLSFKPPVGHEENCFSDLSHKKPMLGGASKVGGPLGGLSRAKRGGGTGHNDEQMPKQMPSELTPRATNTPRRGPEMPTIIEAECEDESELLTRRFERGFERTFFRVRANGAHATGSNTSPRVPAHPPLFEACST